MRIRARCARTFEFDLAISVEVRSAALTTYRRRGRVLGAAASQEALCRRRHGSQRPAFTPLSAGTRDLFSRPLGVVSFGSYARIQAPDLSETRPSGLPEAPRGPSGEGRAPRRVRLAPLDYRTRTLGAHCPRSPGAAGRPQCRQPEARNARRRPVRFTCELSWPLTMRCVCRAAASPSSIHRGTPRY